MKKFDNLLREINERSPLGYLFDYGYTPETVKKEIIITLTPFFQNPENLNKYSIELMVSDWIEFLILKQYHSSSVQIIEKVINHYNTAKTKDSVSVFKTINYLLPHIVNSGNKFWSIWNLEIDKTQLEFDEFVQTTMRNISDIVEGLMKSFLFENLAIDRINRNKNIDIENIMELKIGVIVDELTNNCPFGNCFKIPTENLKITDWRNIAAHHNYKVVSGNRLQCVYGSRDKITFSLTRSELLDIVKTINFTMRLLNLSHKIFFFDNFDDIVNINPIDKSLVLKDEIGLMTFATSVQSQGFKIVDIYYQKGGDSFLIVKDLTDCNPIKRGIHASQFTIDFGIFHKVNLQL